MVAFSENLKRSLHRSLDFANYGAKEIITVEHLLVSLLWDDDVIAGLKACEVDLLSLKNRLRSYLETELEEFTDFDKKIEPQPTANFQRVIHRAIIHVQSSGRTEVSGAHVLVALFAERESEAVRFLQEQGVTRLVVVKNILQAQKNGTDRIVTKAKKSIIDKSGNEPIKADKVFICYRRSDSAASAQIIFDRLKLEFGIERVFLDVVSNPPGTNYVKSFDEELPKYNVMLVVIGKNWLVRDDEDAACRLSQDKDPVRVEIRSAIQNNIELIPIFVDGASMPKVDQLPKDIQVLIQQTGVNLYHDLYDASFEKLLNNLKPRLGLTP